MMIDPYEPNFKKIGLYENSVLKKVLPNAHFKKTGYTLSGDLLLKKFDALISSEKLFEGTQYKFDESSSFVHFTSLPALSQILKSGFLRMSDFNCLSDKSELHFASSIFSKGENKKIEEAKPNIFCLSACLSSPEILDSQHMWNQYASKGMGCAIEYKFTSTKIHNMIFGKVLYGKENLKNLRKLKKLNDAFKNEHDLEVTDLPMLLLKVSAFHKKISFKKENEVRLLFLNDGFFSKESIHRNHYEDLYTDQQVRNFIRLPIAGKNTYVNEDTINLEKELGFSPQIEISRVIIGPNNPNPLEVAQHLKLLQEELGIQFEIWMKKKLNCRKSFNHFFSSIQRGLFFSKKKMSTFRLINNNKNQ